MPIHIGELISEVNVLDGDLPLGEAQIEKLVALVLKRLEQKQRETQQERAATILRRESAPRLPIDE